MKHTITLPNTYSEGMWAKSKVKNHKKYIGKPYLSWSQIESFKDKSGFNTGLKGAYEYMQKYFSGQRWDDMGWAQFGSEAEAYITLRDKDITKLDEYDAQCLTDAMENFSAEEKATLEKIKPLGVFQEEICYYVEELDIVVVGYIDDRSRTVKGKVKLLRDYKTKSEGSKKDLHLPKKYQIELYVLGLRQKGIEVEAAEYCIIERLGGKECMNGGGRGVLTVGNRIWYEPYNLTEERLVETHQMIVETATYISSLYSTYLKLIA